MLNINRCWCCYLSDLLFIFCAVRRLRVCAICDGIAVRSHILLFLENQQFRCSIFAVYASNHPLSLYDAVLLIIISAFFSFSSRLVWMVLLSHFMTSHPTPFSFCFNDHYFLNLYRISQLEPELIQMKYIAHFSLLSFFFWQHFPFFELFNKKKTINVWMYCAPARHWFWRAFELLNAQITLLPIDFLI